MFHLSLALRSDKTSGFVSEISKSDCENIDNPAKEKESAGEEKKQSGAHFSCIEAMPPEETEEHHQHQRHSVALNTLRITHLFSLVGAGDGPGGGFKKTTGSVSWWYLPGEYPGPLLENE